jgi:hypothetical protein
LLIDGAVQFTGKRFYYHDGGSFAVMDSQSVAVYGEVIVMLIFYCSLSTDMFFLFEQFGVVE